MIIASLDVQGAFSCAPHVLLGEKEETMGLLFLPFMTTYIATLLYTILTEAGLTPWSNRHVPHGGAECPFLYVLVTLPLAFELAHKYPAYTP